MSIQKIKNDWYRLDVGVGDERLTFFGHSREEVKQKFKRWLRAYDLSKR